MVYEIENHDSLKAAVDEICVFLSSRAVAEERIFDCKLVMYELLANSLEHSGGRAWLQVALEQGKIHITVRAEMTYCPPKKGVCPSIEAERGRGLFLVDSLSVERIFTEDREIKVVIPAI